MSQVNVRVDDEVKKEAEEILDEMGLSMTTAVNVFLKTVVRERRIPFEISADPFYSDANMKYLNKKMEEYRAGSIRTKEHDLI